MPTQKITKTVVDRATVPTGTNKRQVFIWDKELKGFGLLVSSTGSKSFVAQANGKRITVGRYPDLTAKKARDKAHAMLVKLREEDARPGPAEDDRRTLRKAVEEYVTAMRQRALSERSVDDLRDRMERLLGDWLDRPLDEISRQEVVERHAKIGKENGKYMANGTMRWFRAVYNDALAVDETLPANPCVALRKRWFREYRRQEPVADLRGWWLDVQKMENPIRRCFQMVVLTTGLRSEDARTIRWEHIDFERATLTRPRPKGGEDRAFTVPLSNFTMGLLRHLRRQIEILYPKAPWVFPSVGRDRQIIHMKSPREWRLGLPSPHRLRDTYTSACHEAGLSPYDIDVLTNHRPPTGNVTAGYIRQSDDHLRHCQEKVTARLLGSVMKERHDVSGRG